MSKKNFLIEIIDLLIDKDVNFIVAGGVAVVLQGVERMTMDLDVAVEMDRENLKKFLSAMSELKLVPRVPIPAESILDKSVVKMMVEQKNALVFTFIDPKEPFRQVDLFLAPGLTYGELINDVELKIINMRPQKVLTKEKLIELKQKVDPIRDKDVFDIKALQALINNVEVTDD